MTLQPLLQASPAIQIHAWAAIAAFGLGAVVLFRRKGGRVHRMMGRAWVGLMLVVALSSFFIHTIRTWGPWSPIHLLSIGTLVALALGVAAIRRRDIARHKRIMQSTFLGALVIAGFFTLMPGRIMHSVLFSTPSPAQDGIGVLNIVAGTPLWVWPLMAWTLFTGWRLTRDRVVAPWRLLVMPSIATGLVAWNLATAGATAGMLAAFAFGIAAGAVAGLAMARRRPAERLDTGMPRVRGDWLPLVLVAGIFAVRYAQGIIRAADPGLAASAPFAAGGMFASGLFAAMMIGRTLGQLPAGMVRLPLPLR